MTITVLITDKNLVVQGDPVRWTALDATIKFNEPGTGSFTAAATPTLMSQLGDGNRVVVIRDGTVFMAGRIEARGPYRWSATGEASDPGQIEVHFSDDLAMTVPELAYPDPAAAATAQTTTTAWTYSGNAELAMRALVNLNVGPGALTARRLPQLALGSVAGVGTSISYTARFEPLGDALRSIALAGGGLGFRTRQSGTQILFEVYAPTDRSASVRFSRGLRNLREVVYTPQAPKATVAIVAGQGEGTARTIRERINTAAVTAWGRIESFVDQRSTNVNSELDAAGDEELATKGASSTLSTVTVDTPDQTYGVHYNLGDKVGVEPVPGATVIDVVRAVRLDAGRDGERVTATVGSADSTTDPQVMEQLHAIERRLSLLEAV